MILNNSSHDFLEYEYIHTENDYLSKKMKYILMHSTLM